MQPVLAILADAICIDNTKIENGTMANSILLETLQYVGFRESDIHWFTHVLLETVEAPCHSYLQDGSENHVPLSTVSPFP